LNADLTCIVDQVVESVELGIGGVYAGAQR
jgi:hypothetical protein